MDNLNGASLLRRTLRVDHCEKYKLPPELRDKEEEDDTMVPPSPSSRRAPPTATRTSRRPRRWNGASTSSRRLPTILSSATATGSVRRGRREARGQKAKKASKKEKKRKHEKKDKKSKKKAKTDDEAPLLNYRREELPEPAQAPLVPQGRQGEVTAPSWRGSREPGAPQSWSRRDGPKKRSDAQRGGRGARSSATGTSAMVWAKGGKPPARHPLLLHALSRVVAVAVVNHGPQVPARAEMLVVGTWSGTAGSQNPRQNSQTRRVAPVSYAGTAPKASSLTRAARCTPAQHSPHHVGLSSGGTRRRTARGGCCRSQTALRSFGRYKSPIARDSAV